MQLVETQQQVRNRAETKLGLKFPDTQPDDRSPQAPFNDYVTID